MKPIKNRNFHPVDAGKELFVCAWSVVHSIEDGVAKFLKLREEEEKKARECDKMFFSF